MPKKPSRRKPSGQKPPQPAEHAPADPSQSFADFLAEATPGGAGAERHPQDFNHIEEWITPADYLLTPYGQMLDQALQANPPAIDATDPRPIEALMALHRKRVKTPRDAWRAMIHSGAADLPAPPWAAVIFGDVWIARHRNPDIDLNKVFGFIGWKQGETSQAEREMLDKRNDVSMLNVWRLTLLGRTVESACDMEAGRAQREGAAWNRSLYDIVPDLRAADPDVAAQKRDRFAGSLRTMFYRWRTDIEKDPTFKTVVLADLAQHKDEFLANFPAE